MPQLLSIPDGKEQETTIQVVVEKDQLIPTVFEGQKIICPDCSISHALRQALDEQGELTNAVMFFECPKSLNTHIAAIRGQLMDGFRRELH
jgi:hypothetical protein